MTLCTRRIFSEPIRFRLDGTGSAKTRIIRFFLSGGIAAGLYFALATSFLFGGVDPWLAGLGAYALAFGIGYSLQQRWTFSGRARHRRALPRYGLLQAGCAAASAVLLRLGSLAGFHPLAASVIATLLLGLVSYAASRRWVFVDD